MQGNWHLLHECKWHCGPSWTQVQYKSYSRKKNKTLHTTVNKDSAYEKIVLYRNPDLSVLTLSLLLITTFFPYVYS